MLRLNRCVATRSSAVQRPRVFGGTLMRIVFEPGSHCFRTERRVERSRFSESCARIRTLMRARARTLRRWTQIRTDDTRSGWVVAGGGGGDGGCGGGGGGGGPGGGGPGGGGPGGGGGGDEEPTAIVPAIPTPPLPPWSEQK